MSETSDQSRARARRSRTISWMAGAALMTTAVIGVGQSAHAAIEMTSVVSTVGTFESWYQDMRVGAGAIYLVSAIPNAADPFLPPPGHTINRLIPGSAPVRIAGVSGSGGGDGGPALDASFEVNDFVVTGDGTIYIADDLTHTVRKIGTDGKITKVAGSGSTSSSGDGGQATSAGMDPRRVAVDSTGNVFIADQSNFRKPTPATASIRKVTPAGVISTVVAFPDQLGPFVPKPWAEQIEIDAADNLWVARVYTSGSGIPVKQLLKITPNGTSTVTSTEDFIGMIATAADGTTYVSGGNFNATVFTLSKFDAAGHLVTLNTSPMDPALPLKDGPLATAWIGGLTRVSPTGDLFLLERISENLELPPTSRLRAITNASPLAAAQPVQPARILDTRPGPEQTGYTGDKPAAGATVSLQVAGRGGVPTSGAAAVTMNVTLTEANAAGYVTVWPSGIDRPLSSNLNAEGLGSTVANLVTVPLGADGKVNLFTQTGGHLIADVSGWIPAGVYVPKTPTRVLDTRPGPEQVGYTGEKPTAGQTVDLQIGGVAGVPANGVSAVVFNVTATDATAPGFVTVWPTGQALPTASSLNLGAVGATAPNQVTVPIGTGGKVSFFTQSGTHLLADLAGYYTVSSGFTPLTPARILDTRPGPGQIGYTGDKPGAGATVSVAVAGHGGVPSTGAGSVVLNVTATEATGPGFVTVWPGQTARPNSSVLNLTAVGDTRPNAVLVPLGTDGAVNLFTQSGTHLVVDVAGWFPG